MTLEELLANWREDAAGRPFDHCWQRAMNGLGPDGSPLRRCSVSHRRVEHDGRSVEMPCRPGELYIIRPWPDQSIVKIGCTTVGVTRRLEMHRGNGLPAAILLAHATVPCALGGERFVHAALIQHHIMRELFDMDGVLAGLDSLPTFEGAAITWQYVEAA